MYNVDNLEEKWFKYRRKKALLPMLSLVLLGSAIYLAPKYVDFTGSIVDGNLSVNGVLVTEISSDIFTTKSNNNTIASNDKELSSEIPSMRLPSQDSNSQVGKIIFQNEENNSTFRLRTRKKIHIEVTEKGDKDIAKEIESRFKFAKDKSDSLFLSKYYYDKGNYKKAENWALETNKIDSGIEESWSIFAKTLVKRGKRADAIKVLQTYYDDTNSVDTKSLMDKIRLGKKF